MKCKIIGHEIFARTWFDDYFVACYHEVGNTRKLMTNKYDDYLKMENRELLRSSFTGEGNLISHYEKLMREV